jgi:xanthosine utilization system XapX-like protein
MWMGSAVYVFSVGYPSPRPGYEFVTKMKWTDKTRYIFFYHVFGLFWINAFIVGCTEFIIGASACIWYFECNTDSKGKGTVSRGYHWLLRYHLGSIAFGAFCIAVAQMIRFLFEYYRKKIQTMAPTKLVKAIICATRYCLWVMEKCVKYMTKNAYIQIALTNNNFCKSAWNAFTLMLKHAHRFGAGNSVGFIYNLFGVAVIAASTSGAGYMFMTNRNDLFDLSDPIPPTVALALISGTIGMLFLSIFSYSSDAILQSFLLDEELRFLG